MSAGAFSVDKLTTGVLALIAFLPGIFSNDMTTPVLGVGVSTVVGAVAGTYAAIGYDETTRPRGRLFTVAISTVIMACTLVGWLPRAMGWEWATGGTEAALAAAAAVAIYYLLTPAITRIRELIRSMRLADLLPWRKSGAAPHTPPSGGEDDTR